MLGVLCHIASERGHRTGTIEIVFHTNVGGIPNSAVNKDEKEGSTIRARKDA